MSVTGMSACFLFVWPVKHKVTLLHIKNVFGLTDVLSCVKCWACGFERGLKKITQIFKRRA